MGSRVRPGLAIAVGLTALAGAGCWLMNLLEGADARWAIAAWLLFAMVALSEAARRPRARALAVAGIGVATALTAAWLGDRAGVTFWWLAGAAAWWTALARWDWLARPGLAVLDGLLATTVVGAAVMTAIGVAEPAMSAAGLWTALLVPWASWRGASWLAHIGGR